MLHEYFPQVAAFRRQEFIAYNTRSYLCIDVIIIVCTPPGTFLNLFCVSKSRLNDADHLPEFCVTRFLVHVANPSFEERAARLWNSVHELPCRKRNRCKSHCSNLENITTEARDIGIQGFGNVCYL